MIQWGPMPLKSLDDHPSGFHTPKHQLESQIVQEHGLKIKASTN